MAIAIICGHISDRIGRKKTYIIGCVTMAVFGFLYFAMIDSAAPAVVFLAIVLSLINMLLRAIARDVERE